MCFFFLFLLMELISNIRSFYLSWRTLFSIFSESDKLATNSEDVFIFHSFLKYLNILDLRLLVDYFWHFVYINLQPSVLHSLQWKVSYLVPLYVISHIFTWCSRFSLYSLSTFYFCDTSQYGSLCLPWGSLTLVLIFYILFTKLSTIISLKFLSSFCFLLPLRNFDYTYVIVLNEVSHF